MFKVRESRAPVVGEGEPSSWVGEQRSGFGIPYNVLTTDRRPFARTVQETIEKDLEAMGFQVAQVNIDLPRGQEAIARSLRDSGAERAVFVEILKFNSNTYHNIDVEWDFEVQVFGPSGAHLADNRIEGRTTLSGSLLNAPGAAKQRVPPFFYQLMRELVVENAEVTKALAGEVPGRVVPPLGCTVEQILAMRDSGLGEQQIKAACEGVVPEPPTPPVKEEQSSGPQATEGDDWLSALKAVDAQLLAGEGVGALPTATALAARMATRMHEGHPGGSHLMAAATAFRALAETATGNDQHGLWLWELANSLDPEFSDAEISKYGDNGKWLEDQVGCRDSAEPDLDDVAPPTIIKKVYPANPVRTARGSVPVEVAFRIVVDENGVPRCPRLIDLQGSPGLAYVAGEALRGWRFEPATKAGEPIAVPYTVGIEFSSR